MLETYEFGDFRLDPAKRLLTKGGSVVKLGSRAFDLLVVLVQRSGAVLSTNELLALVWPNIHVEANNLRVHLTALRKALGDEPGGTGYIANIPGRGYSFSATVSARNTAMRESADASRMLSEAVVGRAEIVHELGRLLETRRFITLIGPGGIGKTTVAREVANQQRAERQIAFADLGDLSHPGQVAGAIGSALGRALRPSDPIEDIVAFLGDRPVLLVLDSCDHVIDETGRLSSLLLARLPGLSFLATARSPLRLNNEWVQRLGPLDLPREESVGQADVALQFSAVELFVKLAAASMGGYALGDTEAPVVVDICRRLDGIPLAIELAAARAGVAGINALAKSLANPDRLLSQTQHAGAARHRTLHATFDWSYSLLSETERTVLRRLAVFLGGFSLESACAVVAEGALAKSDVEDALLTLAEKSLIAPFPHTVAVAYRLLDTARAFSRNALIGSGELRELEARHAAHYRDLFTSAGQDWERLPTTEWLDLYGWQVGNVRAALDWSGSDHGDPGLCVQLTAAAVPLWIQLSLIDECLERVRLALDIAKQTPGLDPRIRMRLLAALGWPQIAAMSGRSGLAASWQEVLTIAEQVGDVDYQLRALWALWVDCKNRGAPKEGLLLADRFCALAQQSSEPLDAMVGKRLRGSSLHVLARHDEAREAVQEMLRQYVAPRRRSHLIRFQFDQRAAAFNVLARDAWLAGDSRRAKSLIDESLAATSHKLSRSFVLAEGACPTAFLMGDVELLGRYTDLLASETRAQALDVWHGYAECFRGDLMIREGRAAEGVSMLTEAIDGLSRARFVFNHPMFTGALAAGLTEIGHDLQARQILDATVANCEENGDIWYVPELYRLKGCIGPERFGGGADDSVTLLRTSIRIAQEQGAKAFAFRSTTSLARLLAGRGDKRKARELLSPLLAEFADDPTADFLAASKLLASL